MAFEAVKTSARRSENSEMGTKGHCREAEAEIGSLPKTSSLDALYGGFVGLGIAVALILASLPFGARAFGMGDAKVIVFLGTLLGSESVVVAVFASTLSARLYAVVLLATRPRQFGDYLPHGPFLVMGGLIGLLWGTEIWDWYVR